MNKTCYIFDVDGVIIDVSEKVQVAKELAKAKGINWKTLFHSKELLSLDRPRKLGLEIVKDRLRKGVVIFITGRPAHLREETIEELRRLIGIEKPLLITVPRIEGASLISRKLLAFRKAAEMCQKVVEYHDDNVNVLRVVRVEYPTINLFLHENDSVKIFSVYK
ncbi:MAG: hypothetical protein DRO10_03680 [Thermoprotei archaeon]|nr:MAG: hypothetical protein DRO10_03680 [Thermoprotei archaeon]